MLCCLQLVQERRDSLSSDPVASCAAADLPLLLEMKVRHGRPRRSRYPVCQRPPRSWYLTESFDSTRPSAAQALIERARRAAVGRASSAGGAGGRDAAGGGGGGREEGPGRAGARPG